MFARDDCVEAVDECGRWERATILEIESLGYRVGFVGWGKKHDRWAKPTEVREITPVEVCGRS